MAAAFRRVIQTVDSHTEGNSTRVITGGYPVPPGRTLLERRAWLWRHDDGLRRMLNFEPRGHGMMCSVLLMPALDEHADFSVIIMEQDEYVPMCGHCMIGTAMTVVATGMLAASEPLTTVEGRVYRALRTLELQDLVKVLAAHPPWCRRPGHQGAVAANPFQGDCETDAKVRSEL